MRSWESAKEKKPYHNVNTFCFFTFCCLALNFFLFILGSLAADEVDISILIDENKTWAQQPIHGTISITHDITRKIDNTSFVLGTEHLKVEPIREVKVDTAKSLIISIYHFQIPGQPKGLYALPTLKVNIGDITYESPRISYAVKELGTGLEGSTVTAPINESIPVLKLSSLVESPPHLYPGQQIKVTYIYAFNDTIELTKEILPLFEAPEFLKIGGKESSQEQQNGMSLTKISQVLEATKPGQYPFEGGEVEGLVYKTGPLGDKIPVNPPLRAKSDPITITVEPFPENGKPASFNGAIGPFSSFGVSLKSPSSINLGDKAVLDVQITGTGKLDTAPVPELCCQPGFSGLFQLSDLPPIEQIKDKTKHFIVEMRPLSDTIKAVPSVEFSYFSPEGGTYKILRSDPIPLTVKPLPLAVEKQPEQKQEVVSTSKVDWRSEAQEPAAIAIKGIEPLETNDLYNLRFGSWYVLWLLPLGLLVLAGQLWLRRHFFHKIKVAKQKNSAVLFKEALQFPPSSSEFYQRLPAAFLERLQEKGWISTEIDAVERLPGEGIPGEVKDFFWDIQEKRFTGKDANLDQTVVSDAKALFEKI